MTQSTLFNIVIIPSNKVNPEGKSTSQIAYEFISPRFSELEEKILNALRAKPMACFEMEQFLGLTHQTCSSRFSSLKKRGIIEPSGSRVPTPSGVKADVYVLSGPSDLGSRRDNTSVHGSSHEKGIALSPPSGNSDGHLINNF